MASESLLDAALACAGRGWPVLPLHGAPAGRCTCGRADCPSPGKHPRTRRGFKDASVDVEVIRRWWATWPDANLGVRTGAVSGLLVLDVDVGEGKDGPRELADLEAQHGPVPETPQVLTGGGGTHYLFKHPGARVASTPHALGAGLDLRADDAYIVAPPSVHASGRPYIWEIEHYPDDVPLADAPVWLLNGAGARRPPAADPPPVIPPAAPDAATVGRLDLRPDAEPPSGKLTALLANDPRVFKPTWEHKRRDLPSQSEYDLALADAGVRAGWADVEIGALIVAHRRAGGSDLAKAVRPDYLARTIAKARAGFQAEGEVRAAADALAAAAQEPEGAVDDDRRAVLLAAASKVLGVDVADFEQFGRDPETAVFTFVLASGRRVLLGSATDVLTQKRVQAGIFTETGRAVRALKPPAWADLCSALGRARRLVENDDGLRTIETREWLHQYSCRVHVHDEKTDAVPLNSPFRHDGHLYVHAPSLMRFVKMDLCQMQVDRADLWSRLHELGYAPVAVSTRVTGSGVVARRYWCGPDLGERPEAPPAWIGGLSTDLASRV